MKCRINHEKWEKLGRPPATAAQEENQNIIIAQRKVIRKRRHPTGYSFLPFDDDGGFRRSWQEARPKMKLKKICAPFPRIPPTVLRFFFTHMLSTPIGASFVVHGWALKPNEHQGCRHASHTGRCSLRITTKSGKVRVWLFLQEVVFTLLLCYCCWLAWLRKDLADVQPKLTCNSRWLR